MKKFLIIASLIAVTAILINYSLGGFQAVEPGLISGENMVVYGRTYEGRYNSAALDELIDELRGELTSQENSGTLTIINYLQPELEKRGTVRQFVGIAWNQAPASTSYDSLIINAYNGVQFAIPVKPLVMPSPEKLSSLAEEFSNKMGTTLGAFSIEQYRDNTLIVNFPFE